MNTALQYEPRVRHIPMPSSGGFMAALDFGPADRPVDIVFSHANGLNARTYRTILAPLAAQLRIVALDLRGHGASTLPADPALSAGWRGYAEDLLAFLKAAVDRPVVLAGHSVGATSSLIAAVEKPERVRSLVLFEPVLFPSKLRAAPL
jgi:pimeloyl-ACP methyl ester carboxylesterase